MLTVLYSCEFGSSFVNGKEFVSDENGSVFVSEREPDCSYDEYIIT